MWELCTFTLPNASLSSQGISVQQKIIPGKVDYSGTTVSRGKLWWYLLQICHKSLALSVKIFRWMIFTNVFATWYKQLTCFQDLIPEKYVESDPFYIVFVSNGTERENNKFWYTENGCFCWEIVLIMWL